MLEAARVGVAVVGAAMLEAAGVGVAIDGAATVEAAGVEVATDGAAPESHPTRNATSPAEITTTETLRCTRPVL